jgi:hypothetical protein
MGSKANCMMFRLLLIFVALQSVCVAQRKTITAPKISTTPKIDGRLDEAVWQTAEAATDFVQNYPVFNAPLSTESQVRLLYDNNAIYIGAYLQDDPALIRKQLTSRDGEQQQDVDYFSVFFDTYNDQQNGFQFLVTSANVQTDAKVTPASSGNYGDFGDKTWDAVWESKTRIDDKGWYVEMRIPYISLRFAAKDVQAWGLQFLRFSRRNNETAFWNAVDPNVNGFVNQFGKLTELQKIQPPLRLSFSPYVSGGVHFKEKGSTKKSEVLRSGGADVKWGINESFTLDATLIPDFGQVVSDNVINNLTPFEQRFQENRPFFTEGTELFNKAGLFYSRRIGARPGGYGRVQGLYGNPDQYTIHKNPALTQLYNAVKLSGRTEKKLGIGVFNAVTAPMHAELYDVTTGEEIKVQTEPLANYNIIVLDQAFKGRSSITFTNASVFRNSAARDANVSAFDWALFNKKNSHAVTGTLRYSNIFGYTPYSGTHFMNTDTTTINGRRYLNPYDGFAANLRIGKVSGKLRYNASVAIESDKYDPNDLGYLEAPNEITKQVAISYNEYEPSTYFLNYSYNLSYRHQSLYKPSVFTMSEITARGFWLFKNFWDVGFSVSLQPKGDMAFFELQTKGYQLHKPWAYYLEASGSTDSRKRWFVDYELAFAEGAEVYKPYYKTQVGVRYRFSNKFTLDIDFDRQHDKLQMGYAFLRESNGAPIVGYRDYKDVSSVISGTYNFTPRMNLSVRSRHYWSNVKYLSFHNVDAKGNQSLRPFIDGQDQNFNLYNLDAFFTWDFRLGSRVILGWKNWLGDEPIDGLRNTNYFKNFNRTFDASHGNELTIRFIYFLDYNQLRKKR